MLTTIEAYKKYNESVMTRTNEAKQTPKEIVLAKYPKARVTKVMHGKIPGDQKKEYQLRTTYRDSMPFSRGKTESEAWKNAAEKISKKETE